MKIIVAVVLVLVLRSTSMHAQTLGYVSVISGNVADWVTTSQALDRGAIEVNPLMGSHPTSTQLAVVKLTSITMQCAMIAMLKHTGHPKMATWIGVGVGAGYGAIAWHNSGMMGRTIQKVQPVPLVER